MYVTAIVLCSTLALICLTAGTPKVLLKGTAATQLQSEVGLSAGLIRFIGLAELAAAAGLLTGLRWPPLGMAAAVGLVALFVGATVVHARQGDFADPRRRLQAALPIMLCLASAATVITLAIRA